MNSAGWRGVEHAISDGNECRKEGGDDWNG